MSNKIHGKGDSKGNSKPGGNSEGNNGKGELGI